MPSINSGRPLICVWHVIRNKGRGKRTQENSDKDHVMLIKLGGRTSNAVCHFPRPLTTAAITSGAQRGGEVDTIPHLLHDCLSYSKHWLWLSRRRRNAVSQSKQIKRNVKTGKRQSDQHLTRITATTPIQRPGVL